MTPPRNRASDFTNAHPVWGAINKLVIQVLPPLVVLGVGAIAAMVISTFLSVHKVVDQNERHAKEIAELKQTVETMKIELTETALVAYNAQLDRFPWKRTPRP